MKRYIYITLAILTTIAFTGCVAGVFDRALISHPHTIKDTFTLLILTEGQPVDGLFAAVLDNPTDDIHITRSDYASVHSTIKNVTVQEAIKHMIPLMDNHCAYDGYLVNRLMYGSVNAGYEIVPTHSKFLCSPSPYISVNYKQDDEMRVTVSLSIIQSGSLHGIHQD